MNRHVKRPTTFGYRALPAHSSLSARASTGGDFGDPQLYQEGRKKTFFKAVNLQDYASETTTLVESVPFAQQTRIPLPQFQDMHPSEEEEQQSQAQSR